MHHTSTPAVHWPDTVDGILDGDQTIMLASVTPANGVVLLPVTNFAVRDREAGTLTAVNSSVGVSRKLERIRLNPRVALAYHTREYGLSDRHEYVLAQGTATLSDPDPRYMDSIRESFERLGGSDLVGRGPVWDWWLRAWHLRVGVEIAVERIVVWPGLDCRGAPEVHGAPAPRPPDSQRPPAGGTAPRIGQGRAARLAARLPYALLGWAGADGFPMMVPVEVAGSDPRGILLDAPEGLVPPGGRRAGLTAHWCGRGDVGMRQRVHTGWLEAEPGARRVVYAPHTKVAFRIPRSKLAFRIAAGGATRWGMRAARRRGIVPLSDELR